MSIGHLGLFAPHLEPRSAARSTVDDNKQGVLPAVGESPSLGRDILTVGDNKIDARELLADVQWSILARTRQERRRPILHSLSDRRAVQSYTLAFAYAQHTQPLAIYLNHEVAKRALPPECIQWAMQRMRDIPIENFTPGKTRIIPRRLSPDGRSIPAEHLGVADPECSYVMTHAAEETDLPCNADLRHAEVRRIGHFENAAQFHETYGTSARVDGNHVVIPYSDYHRMCNGGVGSALQIDVPAGASLEPIEKFAADVLKRGRQMQGASATEYGYAHITRNDPTRRVLVQSPSESLGIRQQTKTSAGVIRYKVFGWDDNGETAFSGRESAQVRVRKNMQTKTIIVSDWIRDAGT